MIEEFEKTKLKMTDRIDPVFWLVKFINKPFFDSNLIAWEYDFVIKNVRKHRKIVWANIIIIPFIWYGLNLIKSGDVSAEISTIIVALLAPAMVTGAAWFAISFGGIPSKLLDTAMHITFWMFLSFTLSMTIMTVAMIHITHPVFWIGFIVIEVGVIISSMLYDNADGLKIGLDDTMLKHSRAALAYYKKMGIEETDNRN